ncbi:MAG: hypothetical protein ABR552_06010 [Actinomycetota bacterium]|nr:hypothetical protein [Actinomycetota bacterium]
MATAQRSTQRDQDVVRVSRHALRNVAASIYGCARTLFESGSVLTPARRDELLSVILAQANDIVAMTEET